MPDLVRGVPNLLALWFRRNLWRVHPARLTISDSTPIDRPIFLVGLQGGGLTLLARMLRRHPEVVSATGNYHYWAGPDEMQNVLGPILPPDLSGLHAHIPYHPRHPHRDWLYATDELLPMYRRTAADASGAAKKRFEYAIRLALSLHGIKGRPIRFVDKSQSFTVRMRFVQQLLDEHEPHFVLVTRNPYALCYRSAVRVKSLTALDLPFHDRLRLAAQQWANSISCVIEDAPQLSHIFFLRFEDLLAEPDHFLQETCDFLNLSYFSDMLPHAHHSLPLGATGSSKGDRKWFPLRPDVNKSYLSRLDDQMVAIIESRCADLAQQFGYTPEGFESEAMK